MEPISRTWFSAKQKAELWERWRQGQCVADIARGLERRNKSGVYRVLALSGGIRPGPRRRSAIALRLEEREEIYRSLFVQTRGVLKKELIAHLRTGRNIRSPKCGTAKIGLGSIVDAVSIRERPAEAQDRAVPGHWEGDLLCGSNNSYIATLVERQTRFAMLIKISGRETATVVGALSKQVRKLPQELRRSLTWDRGKEMADHKKFTVATDVQVYFCDPRSPWQRGSNENTNGLLRQYFPRRTDLSGYSQAYLNRIALRLNQRPRKTLGFDTPADRLRAVLH